MQLVPAFGVVVPTLRIGAVIRAQRHANRPKDHQTLSELEALLSAGFGFCSAYIAV